jgi:hypothetical protein
LPMLKIGINCAHVATAVGVQHGRLIADRC